MRFLLTFPVACYNIILLCSLSPEYNKVPSEAATLCRDSFVLHIGKNRVCEAPMDNTKRKSNWILPVIVLLCLCMLCGWIWYYQRNRINADIEKLKESVVLINSYDSYGAHAAIGSGVISYQNRGPLYKRDGEFVPGAHQPVWFGDPEVFAPRDTGNSFYTSYTSLDGEGILWYGDHKFYLFGKVMDPKD